MKNLELKVRCDETEFAAVVERACLLASATSLHQRDTYFHVPVGRLKLREIDNGGTRHAELIGYRRPDTDGVRWSVYHRAEIHPDESLELVQALDSTLGIRVVVEKTRQVVLHKRTRIHLDHVENLGYYVELETVVGDDDSGADTELAEIADQLGIGALQTIGGSYSDLLEAAMES